MPGYFYLPSTMSCQSECPPGFYIDANSNQCSQCLQECSICSNPTLQCIQCAIDYYRHSNGHCVSVCADGTYGDPASQLC